MEISGAAMKAELVSRAKALGFGALEVCAVPVDLRQDYYREWIASGQHGSMDWMERNNDRRLKPEALIPEARSIVVVSLNYYQPDPKRAFRIAKYALGDDYHNFMLKRLKQLCRIMREVYGGVQRPYVDTGPVLEKPIAAAAGLGWQGKSTILIEPNGGTWSFLGTIVTTLDLPAGEAVKDRCGTCTRCIEVCPTQAITAPYQLDARRCIAYLTIEHDGAIPMEFREAVGDRLFGCDECLDVCPWNRWASVTREARFSPRDLPLMREMLGWGVAEFTERFRGSPMRRLKLQRFKRNLCVVLGNVGTLSDVPALEAVVQGEDALLAEHADWALERIRTRGGA